MPSVKSVVKNSPSVQSAVENSVPAQSCGSMPPKGFASGRSASYNDFMRAETDKAKLEAFLVALGTRVRGPGRIYFTGGVTALLHAWREMTIDIDLKAEPEPAGLFEAIASLKDELDLNVELASPDDFIPAVPGWRERSLFIARHGPLDFFHYDLSSQALAKLQRGYDRDVSDVRSMVEQGLVSREKLREHFALIEPDLIRYPAIDPASFRQVVMEFCDAKE